jgi:hypothetical protein
MKFKKLIKRNGIWIFLFLLLFSIVFIFIYNSNSVNDSTSTYSIATENTQSSQFVKSLSYSSVSQSCIPDSGYDTCDSYYNDYNSAHAVVTLMSKSHLVGNFKSGYYVGSVTLPIKVTGSSELYLYSGNNVADSWANFWGAVGCNNYGCNGNSLPLTTTITFATPGNEYKGCPVYYAWAKEDNGIDWAWVDVGRGWIGNSDNCINIKSVNCYDNSDCSQNQICDKSGTWQTWSCINGCIPSCSGKTCGDNGCDGSCGSCNVGTCSNGNCIIQDCSTMPSLCNSTQICKDKTCINNYSENDDPNKSGYIIILIILLMFWGLSYIYYKTRKKRK